MTYQTPTAKSPVINDTPTPKRVINFDDIASNPQGLTTLNDTAKLFQRHAETLRRWVRGNKNPFIKPVTVNGFYYFKNSEILEYIEKQQTTA